GGALGYGAGTGGRGDGGHHPVLVGRIFVDDGERAFAVGGHDVTGAGVEGHAIHALADGQHRHLPAGLAVGYHELAVGAAAEEAVGARVERQ
nr:hypothetical protein [Tanacetum cinerariifolium]